MTVQVNGSNNEFDTIMVLNCFLRLRLCDMPWHGLNCFWIYLQLLFVVKTNVGFWISFGRFDEANCVFCELVFIFDWRE